MVRPVLSRFGVLEPKRSGLNTNPLLDSVGVRPLIDQYVYCLTTTFSFPLPEGAKLSPSTQKRERKRGGKRKEGKRPTTRWRW